MGGFAPPPQSLGHMQWISRLDAQSRVPEKMVSIVWVAARGSPCFGHLATPTKKAWGLRWHHPTRARQLESKSFKVYRASIQAAAQAGALHLRPSLDLPCIRGPPGTPGTQFKPKEKPRNLKVTAPGNDRSCGSDEVRLLRRRPRIPDRRDRSKALWNLKVGRHCTRVARSAPGLRRDRN